MLGFFAVMQIPKSRTCRLGKLNEPSETLNLQNWYGLFAGFNM